MALPLNFAPTRIRVPLRTRTRTTFRMLHELGTAALERVLRPAAVTVNVTLPEQGFVRSRVGRWLERTTGAVLIALGARVAIE